MSWKNKNHGIQFYGTLEYFCLNSLPLKICKRFPGGLDGLDTWVGSQTPYNAHNTYNSGMLRSVAFPYPACKMAC